MRGGHAIEDRFWPEEGHFIHKVDKLPVLLGVQSFYLVPNSWREVIERFEPGVHQFKHVPLFYKDGSPVEEEFHAINIRQAHDDVTDIENSTAPLNKNHPKRKRLFVDTSDTAKVCFKKSALGTYHIWCPHEILIYYIAMSNELYAAIAETGGMKAIRTLEVEEI